MRVLKLLIYFLLSNSMVFGSTTQLEQNVQLDSIEYLLNNDRTNEALIQLNDLKNSNSSSKISRGDIFYYLIICQYNLRDRDSIIYYAKKAILLLEKEKKDELMANSYYYLSYAQLIVGSYESALNNIKIATKQYGALKDTVGLITAYQWNSIIYHDTKEYILGIEYGLKAYDLANKYKSKTADLKAKVLNAIAINYDDNGDFDMAIAYHKKVIALKYELSDTLKLAPTYNNIGNSLMKKGDYKTAKLFFLKNKVITELKKSKYGQATVYTNLGTVAYLNQNWKDAAYFLNKAESISFEINDVEKIQDVLFQQYKYYEAHSNLTKALNYLTSYYQLKDSLLNIDKINALQKLETHYKTKEKETEIEQQQLVITNQGLLLQKNTILIIALIVLVLLLLLVGFLIKTRLTKKQQLTLQQKEIDYKEAQLASIISAQEKERARFSSDLHDSFGQTISILKMNIKTVQQELAPSTKSESLFEDSKKMLNAMYDELRAVCANLMPTTLQKLGLVDALNEFAQRVNNSGQINISISNFGLTSRMDDLQEIALYRIVQEWVNNILKYGNAKTVLVQITADFEEVTITIEDNGMGFDKALLAETKGNGWKNINSRIKFLNGTVEVDTNQNRNGTTLILNFPPKSTS